MEISNQEYFELIQEKARLDTLREYLAKKNQLYVSNKDIERIIDKEIFNDKRRTKES